MQRVVKCLIVDDLPENLLALAALLESPKVEVLQARSGRQALELLLEHEVALAIIDVHMPEIDGFELAELIRGSERTRSTPIIFVTAGLPDERWQFKGYQSGAVDVLFKPISPTLLRSKSEVFFDLYRHRQVLKEQLQQLSELLRSYEMFSAILGHDLRSPLSAVMFSADLLRRQVADESQRKAVDRIIDSGSRMTHMIEEMLDVARARHMGGIAVDPEEADLQTVATRAVEEHRAAAGDDRIVLTFAGDTQGYWDAGRLAQLLSNLLGNAVQHGQAGTISIHVDGSSQDQVRLRVENRGEIPAELVANLFDPFHVRKRRSGRAHNLGLGLYIARQIALSHGGDLALRNDRPGCTCFEAVLPRRQEAPATAE